MISINPLNVLNLREVAVPLPHFHYSYFDIKSNKVLLLKNWVHKHLKSRFYFNEALVLSNNQFVIKVKIGFEEPKEASFLLLACPHLH
jgi:hypothetical protein